MAYHNRNRLKRIEYIIKVYNEVKKPDIPDSFIVRNIFPKHHIYISYRLWMNIKNMKLSDRQPKQPSLFENL